MDKVKLKELALSITDGEHASVPYDANGKHFLLGAKDLVEGRVAIPDSGRTISEADFERIRKRTHLAEDDVLISTTGTIGNLAIATDVANYDFSRDVAMIACDANKLLPEYLYYHLRTPSSQTQLQLVSKGGTQKHLYLDEIADLGIPVPPIETQRNVVSALIAIDNKIANNKKLIAELEATARLVYDYWFTQFDFPDENGRPYRSSGGKMVWNKELKRDIPESWTAGALSSICHYSEDSVSADALDANTYISLDNMLPNYGGITLSDYCPTTDTCKSYSADDTLFGNIRPYFKKVYRAPQDGGCSPDVLVLRPVDNASCFVYETVARDHFVDYVTAGAKGTKMPRGDKDHIMRFKMAVPPQNIISAFEKTVIPLHKCKAHLAEECDALASLRDWLLPMLMNGQAIIRE